MSDSANIPSAKHNTYYFHCDPLSTNAVKPRGVNVCITFLAPLVAMSLHRYFSRTSSLPSKESTPSLSTEATKKANKRVPALENDSKAKRRKPYGVDQAQIGKCAVEQV